jgi:hypothetical protein
VVKRKVAFKWEGGFTLEGEVKVESGAYLKG